MSSLKYDMVFRKVVVWSSLYAKEFKLGRLG